MNDYRYLIPPQTYFPPNCCQLQSAASMRYVFGQVEVKHVAYRKSDLVIHWMLRGKSFMSNLSDVFQSNHLRLSHP